MAAIRHAQRTDSPRATALEKMSAADIAWACASLGWRYFEAKLLGDTATAELMKGAMIGSTCDARWIHTLNDYLKYFGPNGTRREIPYVRADKVGPKVITIKAGAKIGLIGDWGTGAEPAKLILRQLKAQNPNIVIHLGDIYYSGTDEECRVNFEAVVDDVLERSKSTIPVYTLAGNHDMYSGGGAYYELIKRLNKSPMTRPASFFCLRCEDNSWQVVAMDTGLHDYSPFSVTDIVTFVEADEQAWHKQRIQEFFGKTILLSHHQFFSAFSQIGKPDENGKLLPYNPRLNQTFDDFRSTGKEIPAWFWGHEHNLCIYESYQNLACGRCIGHGSIPVFAKDDPYEPLSGITNPLPSSRTQN